MYLPIELWKLILDQKRFDLSVLKSCLLVNSVFNQLAKNIINQIPDTISLDVSYQGKPNLNKQWYRQQDIIPNQEHKIIKQYAEGQTLVMHKGDILRSKIIKFTMSSGNPMAMTYYDVYVPLILDNIMRSIQVYVTLDPKKVERQLMVSYSN